MRLYRARGCDVGEKKSGRGSDYDGNRAGPDYNADMFQTATAIVAVAAMLSWANYKYVRLPSTIGVMLISLLAAAAYVVVVFSIIAQGLTIGPLIRRVCRPTIAPAGLAS